MGSVRLSTCPRNLRYIRRTFEIHLLTRSPLVFAVQHGYNHLSVTHANQFRGAKTVSRRKVKDLTQGALPATALPLQEPDDVPQYPSVLQGVKNNMAKFDQCVVITRVGNFYELYFEHAEEYGPLLGLKVASRSTALGKVAMAGFPFWQLDRFLKILVQDLSKYVAISEEFPVTVSDKVKSGGLQYERKVARVVTPGTLIDENFLDPYQNNFLLAIEWPIDKLPDSADVKKSSTKTEAKVGLAWLDLSTGDFLTQSTTPALLPSILMRVSPREILLSSNIPDTVKEDISLTLGQSSQIVTFHEYRFPFKAMSGWNQLLEVPVDESHEALFPLCEKLAGHRLLDYVRTRLQDLDLRLRSPRRRDENDVLNIDRGSLRGLEILETAKDGLGRGSLFHTVRRTVTKGGSRLLRERLTAPSTSLQEINERLDLVTRFLNSEHLRESIVDSLRRTFDVKRLVQKFAVNRGDADDMLCLARAVSEMSNIHNILRAADTTGIEDEGENCLLSICDRLHLTGPIELGQNIMDAIDEEGLNEKHRINENEDNEVAELLHEVVMKTAPEELPTVARKARPKIRTSSARAHYEENEEPWIMRRHASESLNRLHEHLEALKEERVSLQDRLRTEFGTPKLELRWTPGLGHICHLTSVKALSQPAADALKARVVSSSKTTRSLHIPEWSRLGERLAQARLNIRDEESRIFRQLRQQVIENLIFLRRNAAIIEELDVATSFAVLAQEQGWTRPQLNNTLNHRIVGGRHPTVKLGLEEKGRTFVANDLMLENQERIWVVTGPNMAGKSTFLRQNALITILAQVGSYVPAEHAEIGLVDQMFSRIGAADDLFRNQSTFMVEMLETAAILKHATSRSFVIMDEVGRGTTPEDGTAVSFASLHHLYHTNKCRTLFATHFHALLDMTDDWPNLGRYCTDVLEDRSGSYTFVHKLKRGVNRQSHALKVAKMAGLPDTALDIARLVQKQLMERKHSEVGLHNTANVEEHEGIESAGYS